MSTSSVSINILNYNTYEKSRKCIYSCLKQKYKENIQILLIDNASTDDSLSQLKAEFGSQIAYLVNDENYGFAKGNNVGVDYCLRNGIKYVLLLNSDTELSTSTVLESLLNVINTYKECSVVAPSVYNVTSKGLELNNNDYTYLACLRKLRVIPSNYIIDDHLCTVSEAHGSALLVDAEIFHKVGGFPEHYFMYGEESTFAKKILWEGKLIIWVKSDKEFVFHYHDKTNHVDNWRTYLMGRNKALEYYENKGRARVRWWFAFRIMLINKIRLKDKHFLSGVKEGIYLSKQRSDQNDILLQAKKIKDNY